MSFQHINSNRAYLPGKQNYPRILVTRIQLFQHMESVFWNFTCCDSIGFFFFFFGVGFCVNSVTAKQKADWPTVRRVTQWLQQLKMGKSKQVMEGWEKEPQRHTVSRSGVTDSAHVSRLTSLFQENEVCMRRYQMLAAREGNEGFFLIQRLSLWIS